MKGKILEYVEESRSGLISADDGNRYNFEVREWKGSTLPKAGMQVDFDIDGKNATSIFALSGTSSAGESIHPKYIAALLAFFFGGLGVHKFYLGYKKQGIIMLLIFIFGFILFGIPSFIIGLIAFIEFIIYIIKPEDEFEQTYIEGSKQWF